MRILEGHEFTGLRSWDKQGSVEDARFVRCSFKSCSAATATAPEARLLLQNVQLISCGYQGCSLFTTVFDNVLVDGLRQSGRMPLFLWGCAFRHVVLRGVLSPPIVNANGRLTHQESDPWPATNSAYYVNVDWALDLREAQFSSTFAFHGVPASLVRRDPETQFILRRDTITRIGWSGTHADLPSVLVNSFLSSGVPDTVVGVGRSSQKFDAELREFHALRERGVFESE